MIDEPVRPGEPPAEDPGPLVAPASAAADEPDVPSAGKRPRSKRVLEPHEYERPGGLLSKVDGHIVLYHDPHSLQAEQYRAFRANLVAMNPAGAPWAIAVTSARKGEGKSVSAANLAACLAELPGSRICLVDVDSRAPKQALLLGLTPRLGVTEVLQGQCKLREVLRPTVVNGLDCVHAGAEPPNPAELLGSDAFGSMLTELRRLYSWIVIDAPPVNPFTDPCVVAARCNGAIFVVRLQTAPRELVSSSLDAIRNAGGKLLGTFVTGLTPDSDDEDVAGYERKGADERALLARRGATERARRRAERQRVQAEKATLKRIKSTRAADVADDDEHPV